MLRERAGDRRGLKVRPFRLLICARAAGFTLVELLAVVVTLGILAVYVAPIVVNATSAQNREYDSRNQLTNRQIQEAFLAYTNSQYSQGQLPAPYTGGGYTSTIYNPSDLSAGGAALTQLLTSLAPSSQINDDGTASANVRVYQRVAGLTVTLPFEIQSGPLITLSYQVGAVYLTRCPKGNGGCNPTAATGVPGASAKLTSSNYASYSLSGSDSALVMVSSLARQRSMLLTTRTKLSDLQVKFIDDFRTRQIMAAAGDATNFYPSDTSSLAGQNPASNQGCRDGWYSLPSTSILPNIQLSVSQWASTEWGGPIEFCRDYDPTGTKNPDAPPHSAALRVNANLSQGLAPDSVVPGNNVVFTF